MLAPTVQDGVLSCNLAKIQTLAEGSDETIPLPISMLKRQRRAFEADDGTERTVTNTHSIAPSELDPAEWL